MRPQSLTEKYKPTGLCDIVGQTAAIENLMEFACDPFPNAFIFHGPTGVGKTCTGEALAHDVGCVLGEEEMGGLYRIASGKQDGRAVEDLLKSLRLRPFFGSGWKVAIVNEADHMTKQAEAMWLDGLENLPAKTIIVFTTNDLSSFTDRFLGRCEVVGFRGDTEEFRAGVLDHCREIWEAETGEAFDPPAHLGHLSIEDTENASMRVALKQLSILLRTHKRQAPRTGRVLDWAAWDRQLDAIQVFTTWPQGSP